MLFHFYFHLGSAKFAALLEQPGRVGCGGFGGMTLFGWLHTYSCKFAAAVPKNSNTNWDNQKTRAPPFTPRPHNHPY